MNNEKIKEVLDQLKVISQDIQSMKDNVKWLEISKINLEAAITDLISL